MSSRSPGVPDRRRLNGRRSWLRRRIDSSPPVPTACAIYVVITLLSVGSWVMPFFEGRGISSPPASGPVTPALAPQSAHPLNATDCGLVSATYIQGTVSAIDWPPSYATDVENHLCEPLQRFRIRDTPLPVGRLVLVPANYRERNHYARILGRVEPHPPVRLEGATVVGELVVLHGDLDLLGERPSKRQFVLQGPPVSLERDLGGESPRDQLHRSVPLHLHAIFSWEPPSPSSPGPAAPAYAAWLVPLAGGALVVAMVLFVAVRLGHDSNAPALRDSLEGGGCERVAPGAGCPGRASPGYASVSPGVERRTWTSRIPSRTLSRSLDHRGDLPGSDFSGAVFSRRYGIGFPEN